MLSVGLETAQAASAVTTLPLAPLSKAEVLKKLAEQFPRTDQRVISTVMLLYPMETLTLTERHVKELIAINKGFEFPPSAAAMEYWPLMPYLSEWIKPTPSSTATTTTGSSGGGGASKSPAAAHRLEPCHAILLDRSMRWERSWSAGYLQQPKTTPPSTIGGSGRGSGSGGVDSKTAVPHTDEWWKSATAQIPSVRAVNKQTPYDPRDRLSPVTELALTQWEAEHANNSVAWNNLGVFHWTGYGGLEKSAQRAIECWRKAESLGATSGGAASAELNRMTAVWRVCVTLRFRTSHDLFALLIPERSRELHDLQMANAKADDYRDEMPPSPIPFPAFQTHRFPDVHPSQLVGPEASPPLPTHQPTTAADAKSAPAPQPAAATATATTATPAPAAAALTEAERAGVAVLQTRYDQLTAIDTACESWFVSGFITNGNKIGSLSQLSVEQFSVVCMARTTVVTHAMAPVGGWSGPDSKQTLTPAELNVRDRHYRVLIDLVREAALTERADGSAYPPAMARYARMSAQSWSDTKPDYPEAAALYFRAAAHGYGDAIANVCELLVPGIVPVPPADDPLIARVLKAVAAAGGDVKAIDSKALTKTAIIESLIRYSMDVYSSVNGFTVYSDWSTPIPAAMDTAKLRPPGNQINSFNACVRAVFEDNLPSAVYALGLVLTQLTGTLAPCTYYFAASARDGFENGVLAMSQCAQRAMTYVEPSPAATMQWVMRGLRMGVSRCGRTAWDMNWYLGRTINHERKRAIETILLRECEDDSLDGLMRLARLLCQRAGGKDDGEPWPKGGAPPVSAEGEDFAIVPGWSTHGDTVGVREGRIPPLVKWKLPDLYTARRLLMRARHIAPHDRTVPAELAYLLILGVSRPALFAEVNDAKTTPPMIVSVRPYDPPASDIAAVFGPNADPKSGAVLGTGTAADLRWAQHLIEYAMGTPPIPGMPPQQTIMPAVLDLFSKQSVKLNGTSLGADDRVATHQSKSFSILAGLAAPVMKHVTSIAIGNCALHAADVGPLLAALSRAPHITWLNFADNDTFSDSGVAAVCDALFTPAVDPAVRHQLLALTVRSCHVTTKGLARLAEALPFSRLVRLIIGRNFTDETGAKDAQSAAAIEHDSWRAFGRAVAAHPTLATLDLSEAYFEPEVLPELFDNLSRSRVLTTLVLHSNRLAPDSPAGATFGGTSVAVFAELDPEARATAMEVCCGVGLCTIKVSGHTFARGVWWRCKTCNKPDNCICNICALVCHAGHEIEAGDCTDYYCDCGDTGCVATKSSAPGLAAIKAAQTEAAATATAADTKADAKAAPLTEAVSSDPITSGTTDPAVITSSEPPAGTFAATPILEASTKDMTRGLNKKLSVEERQKMVLDMGQHFTVSKSWPVSDTSASIYSKVNTALCGLLSSCRSLVRLDIGDASISDEALTALIRNNGLCDSRLTELNVSYNPWTDDVCGVWIDYLKSPAASQLERLHFQPTIQADSAKLIEQTLFTCLDDTLCPALKWFDCGSLFWEPIQLDVMELIRRNRTLTYLSVPMNVASTEHVFRGLVEACSSGGGSRLSSLRIGGRSGSDTDVWTATSLTLASLLALPTCPLVRLEYVCSPVLEAEGATPLIRSLRANRSLNELTLNACKLVPAAFTELAEMMKQNRSLSSIELSTALKVIGESDSDQKEFAALDATAQAQARSCSDIRQRLDRNGRIAARTTPLWCRIALLTAFVRSLPTDSKMKLSVLPLVPTVLAYAGYTNPIFAAPTHSAPAKH